MFSFNIKRRGLNVVDEMHVYPVKCWIFMSFVAALLSFTRTSRSEVCSLYSTAPALSGILTVKHTN